jgi:hypothetical protein
VEPGLCGQVGPSASPLRTRQRSVLTVSLKENGRRRINRREGDVRLRSDGKQPIEARDRTRPADEARSHLPRISLPVRAQRGRGAAHPLTCTAEVFVKGERIAVHMRSSGNGKYTTAARPYVHYSGGFAADSRAASGRAEILLLLAAWCRRQAHHLELTFSGR